MARACEPCHRGDRRQIEAMIISGTPLPEVATVRNCSLRSLRRHRASNHIEDYAWPQKPLAPGLRAADVARIRKPKAPAAKASAPIATPAFPRPKTIETAQDAVDDLGWLREKSFHAIETAETPKDSREERARYEAINGKFLEIKRVIGPKATTNFAVDNRRYTLNITGSTAPQEDNDAFMRAYAAAVEAGEPPPALPDSWDIIEGEVVA